MGILVQMVNAICIERGCAAFDAMHAIPLIQQELGKICAVLPGNTRDQCRLRQVVLRPSDLVSGSPLLKQEFAVRQANYSSHYTLQHIATHYLRKRMLRRLDWKRRSSYRSRIQFRCRTLPNINVILACASVDFAPSIGSCELVPIERWPASAHIANLGRKSAQAVPRMALYDKVRQRIDGGPRLYAKSWRLSLGRHTFSSEIDNGLISRISRIP